VIVKHANPCGAAVAESARAAYERAHATDATSAFGGIIAFNRALDGETVNAILQRQFVEVLIAPDYSADALRDIAQKPNVRVLKIPLGGTAAQSAQWDVKRIGGGLLVQEADTRVVDAAELVTVTRRAPTDAERRDLLFAWHLAKYVKSNAIVYARDGRSIGIGAGQTSRVMSARIAALKAAEAGLALNGAVMASDAFLPFRDGLDAAAEAGISAVIQPGGSMRDAEVIAAADEHGMAMVFTGIRHFRH